MKKLKTLFVLIAITVLPQQLLAESHGSVSKVRPDVKAAATKSSEGRSKGPRNLDEVHNASPKARSDTKQSEIKASLNKKIVNLSVKKEALQGRLQVKQEERKNIELQIKETNEEITNLLNQLALIP